MLLGLLLRELNKKLQFPYSPMVLSAGIVLGIGVTNLPFLSDPTAILSKMHPHLILYIFIPVLLFESAFNCDWFVFKKLLVNILILAGPGVIWVLNLL